MSLLRRRMMSSISNSNGGNENLKDYFCIENKGDVDVSVVIPADSGYSYSFNQEVWMDSIGYDLSIPPKSSVYIAANGLDGDFSGYPLPLETNVSGNIMSLLYGHDFEDKYIIEEGQMLQGLFWDCNCTFEGLRLPATVLRSPTAYAFMFCNCVNMKNAPELPAHTLYEACYLGMFADCVNLEKAPILPATTLADCCYNEMFSGCTRLNYIKMLATDISAYDCLLGWTDGVSLTGTFVKHPDMTSLPTGVDGIPDGWTVVNDVEYVKIITFFIEVAIKPEQFRSYQAEEGMTWEEWVNSSYNTEGYYLMETSQKTVILSPIIESFAVATDGTSVAGTEIIIEGYEYELF